MENRKIFGTLERVVLGSKIEFIDDCIEVWVEITEVSDNLQSKIIQAIEEEKERTEENMQCLYNRGWKETVAKDLTLHIIAKKNKPLETFISVYFEEVDNPDVFDSGNFAIDLSEHESELKALIVDGIKNFLN